MFQQETRKKSNLRSKNPDLNFVGSLLQITILTFTFKKMEKKFGHAFVSQLNLYLNGAQLRVKMPVNIH